MRVVVLTLLALVSCTASLAAAESQPAEPVIRLELQPETVEVGQAARLRLTVVGPTWFPKPPVFPSFEVPNAIVRRPPNRASGPATEQVGGEPWSGLYRTYEVYPLMGARYTLGGESVQVTVANPGADPLVYELEIPTVALTAEVPPGAEGLNPYIAGDQFSLRREVVGATDALQAGDALVVRYIAELEGLPAIFLPPLAPDIESRTVSVYADAPVVEENDSAVRTEQITIVLNYGGDLVLPAQEFRWWNRRTGNIETVVIDAVTIAIAGPVIEAGQPAPSRAVDWRAISLLILVFAALVYLLRRYLPMVRASVQAERLRYLASEQHAFDQLSKACGQKDARAAYAALLAWQENLGPESDLRRLAMAGESQKLVAGMEALSAELFANGPGADLKRLAHEAGVVRQQYLEVKQQRQHRTLPLLNPVDS